VPALLRAEEQADSRIREMTPSPGCESNSRFVEVNYLRKTMMIQAEVASIQDTYRSKAEHRSRVVQVSALRKRAPHEKLKNIMSLICALAFIAWSSWIVFEAMAGQDQQRMINEIQAADRP
jgi:hypothetical protein